MQFYRYLRLFRRQWWIFVLLEIVAIASVYYYTTNLPSVYTTSTTLFLNPNVPSNLIPYLDSSYTANLAEDYNILLKSDTFLTLVQKQLLPKYNVSTAELQSSFTSELESANADVYRITVSSNDPNKAQAIANNIATVFIQNGLKQTNSDTSSADQTLNDQVKVQQQELNEVKNDITDTRNQINALSAQPSSLEIQTQITNLKSNLISDYQTQSQLIGTISDLTSKLSVSSGSPAQLLDAAPLPAEPKSNGLERNIIFAFVVALLLGGGLVILLDYLDYTIKTVDDLSQLTGLVTLGAVPIIKGSRPALAAAADSASPENSLSSLDEHLVTATDFKSVASESYRNIRTNLLFQTTSHFDMAETKSYLGFKILLVTSTWASEGKSITAANIAITFAQTGNKVILVDTDLRRPSIHRLFGVPNDKGFTNLVLAGPEKLSSIIKQTAVPNLAIITAGSLPPNPSELLTSSHSAKLIDTLAEVADVVILDSPPVNVVTDAAVLSNRADRVLLVVDWGRTRRDAIQRTMQNLRKVGAKLTGTVLNRVQEKSGSGYYYYYYYGEGSGKVKKRKSTRNKSSATTDTEFAALVQNRLETEVPAEPAEKEAVETGESEVKDTQS